MKIGCSNVRKFGNVAILAIAALALASCIHPEDGADQVQIEPTSLDKEPPRLISAFFGLDNSLPPRAMLIWRRAVGKDGMPLTFSRRVEGSIDPEVFTVITRSGNRLHPAHATTKPAHKYAKRHTVLLIGEMGDEPNDPPVKVEVTGNLALAGGADAKGLSVDVTPLEDGPFLVLAYAVHPEQAGGDLPADTKQVIVVVWAGGVRPIPGVSADDHRLGYSVETTDGDVIPIALGNLGDGDNYEHLYLDTTAAPLSVSMKEGLVMDPRDDPNPATTVEVSRPDRQEK